MRVGLDVTPLPPQPTGAGVYIIELVRALATLPGESGPNHPEWVIIHRPGGREQIETYPLPGVKWVETNLMGTAARLVWEQTVLPRLARALKLDLLHSLHYTRPYWLPCASVVTFHDMTFFLLPQLHTRIKRIFFPMAMRISARRSEALIASSENTRRDAMRILHIPAERIDTVPLGVSDRFRQLSDPTARLDCQQRYNLPDQFILYVGTVEPRKNLPMLLHAYSRLEPPASRMPLVIAGRRGWMFEEVFDLVESLRLSERVHFTGYIPAEDLPMVYNLAELFVYPSLYEGFGFPPLEAMACGTPVITTASSSMQETVSDAGLLVPPGDPSALEAALARLAGDAELRRSLAQKGLQRSAAFTWQHTARLTLEVYRKAVDRR